MADYAEKYTDRELDKLEKRIKREYAKAYEDLAAKADKYFEQYEERWNKEYEAYRKGKYTKQQFQQWEAAQLARGEHWTRLRDQMAQRMHKANVVAAAYINGKLPDIYATNANYQAYEIEKDTKGAVSFEIFNEQAVADVMTGANHAEFRTVSVNPKRDYKWNRQQIDSAIISGILQGMSIGQLTESFLKVMQNNRSAAIRNARTSITSAQNGGRYTTAKRAESMGIDLTKKWVATHDTRTRDSHADIDGEIVGIDDTFSNGLLYAGDPNGKPAEVYNCRCATIYKTKHFNADISGTYADWAAKDYPEWLERKKERNAQKPDVKKETETKQKKQNTHDDKSPTIAGVKRGEPMTFKEADSGSVNPKFYDSTGYQINCQTCVPIFEARTRGYDVETTPNTRGSVNDKLSYRTNLVWIDPKTGEHPKYVYDEEATSAKKYYEFIDKTVKQGERWSIEFVWKSRRSSGHIVNLDRNENGELRIHDNQVPVGVKWYNEESVGKEAVLEYLKEMKYTRTFYGTKMPCVPKLLRLDNMDFDMDVINAIAKAKK